MEADNIKKHYSLGPIEFNILEIEDKFFGMEGISIDDVLVCCDEFPLRIVVTAANGIVYEQYKLLDVQVKDDEIRLETELYGRIPSFSVHSDVLWHSIPPSQDKLLITVCDKLIWCIRPCVRKIGSREYYGFSLKFVFSSEERKLHDIWVYSNWELGAHIKDLYLVCQQWGSSSSPWEWKANYEEFYSTSEYACDKEKCVKFLDMMVRGGGTTLLDFQFRLGHGILTRWFERPVMVTSKVEKADNSALIYFYDRICCSGKTKHETEKMILMVCKDKNLNLLQARNAWLQAFTTIKTETAANYGIHPEEPEPMLFIDTVGFWPQHRPGKQSPDFYEKWISRLDDVVNMGFKRILLHTPGWISDATETGLGNVCCPWDHIVADEFGGNAALERLCLAAHKKNLQVIVWIGSHLSIWCRNLQEHPDWAIRNQDGIPLLLPDVGLNRPGDMNSGLKDKLIEQLRAVRKCGVDGIWYDSFHNIAIRYVVEHPDGTRSLQSVGTLDFLYQLQKIGFVLEIETIGVYGCSSCGIAYDRSEMQPQHISDIKGIEYTAYRTGLSLRSVENYNKLDRDIFFRMMAHQAVLGIHITDAMHFEQAWPIGLPSDIIALQHLYLRLAIYRGPIELIEGGVIWHSKDKPGTRVLWVLEEIPFPEGQYETVQDITDDESVLFSPCSSKARQGRVYLLI